MPRQFAPGKAVITGEHSMLYGYPSLTTALAAGVTVDLDYEQQGTGYVQENTWTIRKDISTSPHNSVIQTAMEHFFHGFKKRLKNSLVQRVESQLPIQTGLGSSSAVAAATLLALAELFEVEMTVGDLESIVLVIEKQLDRKTNPIDSFTVCRRGICRFSYQDQNWSCEALFGSAQHLQNMILIDSGKPFESPQQMMVRVSSFVAGNPSARQTLEQLGGLVQSYVDCLQQNGDMAQLLRYNHQLLQQLPVYGKTAQEIVSYVEQVGGGAKISGPGGLAQGSGMILAYHPNKQALLDLCAQAGWRWLAVV